MQTRRVLTAGCSSSKWWSVVSSWLFKSGVRIQGLGDWQPWLYILSPVSSCPPPDSPTDLARAYNPQPLTPNPLAMGPCSIYPVVSSRSSWLAIYKHTWLMGRLCAEVWSCGRVVGRSYSQHGAGKPHSTISGCSNSCRSLGAIRRGSTIHIRYWSGLPIWLRARECIAGSCRSIVAMATSVSPLSPGVWRRRVSTWVLPGYPKLHVSLFFGSSSHDSMNISGFSWKYLQLCLTKIAKPYV